MVSSSPMSRRKKEPAVAAAQSETGMRPRHAVAVLLSAVFLVYANALPNGLVGFDDTLHLAQAAPEPGMVRGGGLEGALAEARPSGDASTGVGRVYGALFGRHLRWVTHALDFRLFGADYRGHHLMSVAYHAAAACAAFAVALEVLGGVPGALAAALVFALHPLQTESAAYLAGRRDVLMGLFGLWAFYAWLRWRRGGELRWLAAAAASWLVAMSAKETAAALPLCAAAFAVWRGAEASGGLDARGLWRAGVALWTRHPVAALAAALSAAAVLLGIVVPAHMRSSYGLSVMAIQGVDMRWYGGSPATHWLTLPGVLLHAAGLTVFPATLSADYTYGVFPYVQSLLEPRAYLPLAGLVLLGWGAWRAACRAATVGFALSWAVLAYAPHLPVIPSVHNSQLFAEHWLYLALFGPALALGWAFNRAWSAGARRLAGFLCVAVLAALAGRTAVRNRDWRDDLTLWSKTVATSPDCGRARNHLGLAYSSRKRWEEAVGEFQAAIRIDPNWYAPFHNFAEARLAQGRTEEAMELYRRAAMLNPGNLNSRGTLAGLLLVRGRLAEARALLGPNLHQRGTDSPLYRQNRAVLAMLEGRLDDAERDFTRALRLDPRSSAALAGLGSLYLEQGRAEEAARELERAAALDPARPGLRANLALAYARGGRAAQAEEALAQAERLGLAPASAHALRGILLRERGDLTGSLAALNRAVSLAPSADGFSQLGRTLAASGDRSGAERSYRKALALHPTARDHVLLAELLLGGGRAAPARASLRAALELSPAYRPALRLAEEMRGEK